MSFDARITRAPRAFDPDRGAEGVAVLAATGPVADVVAGMAGCSPYLAGLLAKEAEWLGQALADPEAAVEGVLADVAAATLAEAAGAYRQAKRRIALITALADLGGVWPLETVTQVLSRFADAVCDGALRRLVAADVARGRLPELGGTAGLCVLSMGKGGAYELNYSSDIDLIVLYDETAYAPDDLAEARPHLVRITRKMVGLLNDVTAQGYVFRTDLRLRPDPSVTPVCLSMAAAEAYYESVGRTWERAAYIKARAAAGDTAAGERFLETMRPFVWRKHLDFAAIEDAHDMRLKIRAHKKLHGALDLMGHNLKLGRGGIREIEFFTQTRQLIAGGRDPSLRLRGTVEGLAALTQAGWIEEETAHTLTRRYRSHREVEHRLQMINDAQTHDLPGSDEGFERLAAFMGTDAAALKAQLVYDLEEVHHLTEGFFAPDAPEVQEATFGEELTARWPDYPALRSDRAAAIFKRLRPDILAQLQQAAKPEEALGCFDRFLAGLPAGVQLFSLFEANPKLTALMVEICATAPALADYLSRNAGVLDAVIGGAFFDAWPEVADLTAQLATVLAEHEDYEAKLDAARRWTKEWHFRVGVHHLQGVIPAAEAGAQYAALAQAVVAALWPVVQAQFAVRHGAPPGRGAAVLAMGSLGAGRLNAASDLDLIVIYDGQDVEMSDGPKPLMTRQYFARLTQAMITALSAPMAEGRLYEVDMRLRPSGRQGPVATSLTAFETYQREEAWTWEHLALTRARVIAGGDAGLAGDIEAVRCDVLRVKSQGATLRADVADMRRRLAEAKPGAGPLDIKSGAGRLQDVELAAQTLALCAGDAAQGTQAQIGAGVAAGLIDVADGAALSGAAALWWQAQCALRLLIGDASPTTALGEGGLRFLLRETGAADMEALMTRIDETATVAAAQIEAILETPDER